MLYPSTVKSIKTQKALGEIQPKLQEIQRKYKDDKERQVKETIDLYKQAKVSPIGSLLPMIIQLPLLIALYRVFWDGVRPEMLKNLYGFIANPGYINASFLGLVDLSKPSLIMAIIAGIFQFIQSKTSMASVKKTVGKGPDFSAMMQKQMIYFFPFLTVIILLGLPAALGLYWIVGSVFMIGQQYLIFKKQPDTNPN